MFCIVANRQQPQFTKDKHSLLRGDGVDVESGRSRKIEYGVEKSFAELSGRRTSEGVREKAVLADVGR